MELILLLYLLLYTIPYSLCGICPPKCSCDDAALLASCEPGILQEIPIHFNPLVEVMKMSGNRIIHLDSISNYERLRSLDVSNNKLHSLDTGLFKTQHFLSLLNMSNNELNTISSKAFVGLRSIHTLDLSGNKLQLGEAIGVWKGLDSLWELDISRNSLDSLSTEDEDECSPLHNLRTLHLGGNQFQVAPSLCLTKLTSLRHLRLSDNLMNTIEDGAFPTSLRELISLNLEGNQLSRIMAGAFENLSSLQLLDLSDNNLTHIPSATFNKLSNTLIELDLSGNPIINVGPLSFQSLFELRRLHLSRLTELERIDPRAFVDNIRLEEVDIELCPRLKRLPTRLFQGNPLISKISLRGNALQTLTATDLPVGQLRYLSLADNPLRCNCSLIWLWKISREAATAPSNQTPSWALSAGGAVCWEPIEIRGTPIPKAPEAQVGCEASWATVMMVTGVVLSLFILTCAILFYCGGGGRWCTRPDNSDTPISRVNGFKEYPPNPLTTGNVYHHVMHHPHIGHLNMWPPPDTADINSSDLTTTRDYEYADNGKLVCKKPPPNSALGVYV